MKKTLYVVMDNVLVDFQSGFDRVPEETKLLYPENGADKFQGELIKFDPKTSQWPDVVERLRGKAHQPLR